jgi:hypothetical protein
LQNCCHSELVPNLGIDRRHLPEHRDASVVGMTRAG